MHIPVINKSSIPRHITDFKALSAKKQDTMPTFDHRFEMHLVRVLVLFLFFFLNIDLGHEKEVTNIGHGLYHSIILQPGFTAEQNRIEPNASVPTFKQSGFDEYFM